MSWRTLPFLLLLPLNLVSAERLPGQGTATTPRRGLADQLKPCRVPDVEEEVLCGRYEVFENRAAGTGRKIGLNIVVLPAKTPDVAPDPLVFLAGGGVAPATRYARYFSRAFPDLRLRRDVLLVDQRGSGGSNGLECEVSTDPANAEYRDEGRFVEAVRRCRKELEKKADLRYYTTPLAMDDLDEVRGWLGYPKLNLYGVSYGTKAAMVYLRQHPERVRAVALHGVVPLDAPMWLELPRSYQQALEQAFAACAGQQGCHDAFPNLAQEFSTLLKRLAEKPEKVKVSKPGTRQEVEVSIDAEVLRSFVGGVLFSAARIHDLPLLIHFAHEGDYQPLARRVAFRGESEIPRGVYLSIVCSEQVRQFDAAALPAAAAGTFSGEFRLRREFLACGEWTRGWLPENFWAPVRSEVPALVLTGALDHATPPRYGQLVARSLAHSRHVVLPSRGHNDTDPCVSGMIQAFVVAGSSQALDTSCLAKTEELSFALRVEELEGQAANLRVPNTTATPIQETRFVTLGGVEQWITIRGTNRANPVLLIVHGGPGDAQSSLRSAYAVYEKEFTVVQWDQRGAGKTYAKNTSSPPEPERVESDGIELAQYLCGYLGKKKILLLGHSWGSYLAVGMAQRRPELFAAYIGTGQVGSWRANIRAQFDFLLAKARAADDRKRVEQLEAIGTPNPNDAKQYFSWWSMRNPYMSPDDAKWFQELRQIVRSNPEEFTEEYMRTLGEGMSYSGRTTVGSMLATELPTTANIFRVPFFVIQGKEDMVTPTSVAVEYFDAVKAPEKKLILIEHAGHFALVTHQEEFLAALVEYARPLALVN